MLEIDKVETDNMKNWQNRFNRMGIDEVGVDQRVGVIGITLSL